MERNRNIKETINRLRLEAHIVMSYTNATKTHTLVTSADERGAVTLENSCYLVNQTAKRFARNRLILCRNLRVI